jgi:acetyltransferase AlgX (SGNH hydrolase-like protein)
MPGAVEGRLEAVIDGRAVGWAWEPERPEEAVEVEILVDDEPVATGRADLERTVLAEAGIGSGRYGFDVPLPEGLAAEPAHTIRVTAGPEREEIAIFHQFESIVRATGAPWHGTKFLPADGKKRPFVPPAEDPPDPGAAALVGKHGWLFPFDEAHLSAEQLQGAPLLPAAEIERRRQAIAQRRRQLKDLRIPYLFAVAPLKERVYGRFLPPGASLHADRPVAEIDRALRATDGGEVFDLLPALREARRAGRAFPKTGSAWSDRGAFFAYRELMREAGKRVVALADPLLPDDAPLLPREGFRGDLAEKPKLRLTDAGFAPAEEDAEWEEEIDVADVSQLRALRMPAPQHLEVTPGRAPRLYEVPVEPTLPTAVLVGDAPCLGLIPWLAEHFRRFVFLWADELPLEAIELEMPDVVIHVLSESRLLSAQ